MANDADSIRVKDCTVTGTLTAEQITSTDDMSVTDGLSVGGGINVSGNYDSTNGDITLTNGTATAAAFSSADYTVSGTNYRYYWYGVGDLLLDPTNPPALNSTYGHGLAFDDTTTENTYLSLKLPKNYVAGTDLQFIAHWAPATTNTGDCYWYIGVFEHTSGASPVAEVFDIAIQAGNGTAGQHQLATLTALDGTNFVVDDVLSIRFGRSAADVLDTMTGDAILYGVEVRVRIDNLVES